MGTTVGGGWFCWGFCWRFCGGVLLGGSSGWAAGGLCGERRQGTPASSPGGRETAYRRLVKKRGDDLARHRDGWRTGGTHMSRQHVTATGHGNWSRQLVGRSSGRRFLTVQRSSQRRVFHTGHPRREETDSFFVSIGRSGPQSRAARPSPSNYERSFRVPNERESPWRPPWLANGLRLRSRGGRTPCDRGRRSWESSPLGTSGWWASNSRSGIRGPGSAARGARSGRRFASTRSRCARIRGTTWRPCMETLHGDPAWRPCMEILHGDFAWRPCGETLRIGTHQETSTLRKDVSDLRVNLGERITRLETLMEARSEAPRPGG